jgi:DNA-binding transcriptional LysR family regulator
MSPSGWPGGPVDRALGELGLGRRVVVTVPTFAAALDLVATTDLVATLPERLVRLLPPSQLEALSVTPPPVPLAPFRLLALWHARADADPAHRWLRGLLEGV